MSFTIPANLDDALATVASGATPIAGGSDLVVGARHGKAPLPNQLVAIDRLTELGGIERQADGVRIGSVVSHAELMADPVIIAEFTALADAAALIGSPATRHVGTLGGNVMNGSPAMDTGAPLVVFGAHAELRSATATRTVAISDLWTGPGATVAAADELCTGINVPAVAPSTGSAYVRLEYRRAMEIAVVGAAACVTLLDDGTVASARVALSAVAPTIIEVPDIADIVAGQTLTADIAGAVAAAASDRAQPISDLRASDNYRRHTVGVMARRAFTAAAQRAAGTSIAVPVNRSLGIGG